MATVIRSAKISDKAVTLAVHSCAAPPDLHDIHACEPLPIKQVSVLQAPVFEREAAPAIPDQDPNVAMRETLREREKQLEERERSFRDELEAQRRQVIENAHADGYKQGELEAASLYQERLDALHTLITLSKERFESEVSGLEDVIVGIVYEAVCKIMGGSLHDRDGVLAVVREVMCRAKDQEKLVVRVSPHDYNLLYQNKDDLTGGAQGIKFELVPDDRVVLGGCLIETSGGTIDGRLEIQLQQLRETLLSARRMLPE